MLLRDLLKVIPTARVEGRLDREVTSLAYDSRRVVPGAVFFALRGQNVDGHQFISTAIDKGAVAVVCETNGFSSQRASKVKVPDARAALALAAAEFYGHPSKQLKVIGITGTNGKTTVSFLVKRILETSGIQTGLIGTIRYEIGHRMLPAQRTTPEALEVQEMLAQMIRAGCKACVMEVSSHALDQKRVTGVEFDAAIFTNLTRDHLDYHGDFEKYYNAKARLFQMLEGSVKPGAAVINIDDDFGRRLASQVRPAVRLTYGLAEQATLRATQIQLGTDGTRVTIAAPAGQFTCRLPLIGRHNVYNALAAAGAGIALNVPVPEIKQALEQVEPVPGRLESVAPEAPFGVYVDYAHTDDALENVLKTVREITSGRVLLTFGCGGSRDAGKRARMGEVAARLADYTIVTSDNPRKESPAAIAAQIEEGIRNVRAGEYHVELDRQRAIDAIVQMARPGDSVLIAGKGHETYQEFEDTVVPFDDRVHARQAVESALHQQH